MAARSPTAPASCSTSSRRSAAEVGRDFHLQVKLSAVDRNNVIPWERKGNTLADTRPGRQMVRGRRRRRHSRLHRLALPASAEPARRLRLRDHHHDLRRDDLVRRLRVAQLPSVPLPAAAADLPLGLVPDEEGSAGRGRQPRRGAGDQGRRSASRCSTPAATRPPPSSATRSVPAPSTASRSRARSSPTTTSSSSGRAGHDQPERPCTYCNKCLFNAPKNPMGCYELPRFAEPRGDGRRS